MAKLMIGKLNNEFIYVDSNISHLNPITASAMILPLIEHKDIYNIHIPYCPDVAVHSSRAFETFCHFLIKGPVPSVVKIKMDWSDDMKYDIPQSDNLVTALKIDNFMSLLAYHIYKSNKINIFPFIIAFNESDKQNKIAMAKKAGVENIGLMYLDYGKYNEYIRSMDKYENWIASTIASAKSHTVWISVPPAEISDYFPGNTLRMFSEGSDWISRIVGRSVTIASPFVQKTRSEILKYSLHKHIIDDKFLLNIPCRCNGCHECLMNRAMFLNNEMYPDRIYEGEFKNKSYINRLKKLIELDKLNPELVKELSVVLH